MGNKEIKLSVDVLGNSESVQFIITLLNTTDFDKTFIFRTGQKYDLHVLNPEGKEVYRYFKGGFFTQAIEKINLASGQIWEWKETWDYKCAGKRINAGEYIVLVNLIGKAEGEKTLIAKNMFTVSL